MVRFGSFFKETVTFVSLEKWIVIEVSRSTFCVSKIIRKKSEKSQIAKIDGFCAI